MRAASLAVMFLAACRAAPPAQPVSGEHLPLAASASADARAKTESSSDAGMATAIASASPSAANADALEVKDWFCFSWVHGRDFASPCFEAKPACARASQDDAHHDKKPCSLYSGVVFCSPRTQASAPRSCFQEPIRRR